MKKLVCLTLSLAACAQERPPINRVQAVALEKSFYVGAKLLDPSDDPEFYMRGTVVDVGFGAAQDGLFTSTYAQPVSRIRWEITENLLNARLAYERIAGTDGKGLPVNGLTRKGSNDGQIVASYRIVSHFDIKRAYNPTTGEALNVIEENTADRPWFEREHFRVDWSQNLATDVYDFDTLSMMGIYGGITYTPIPYAITDEKHPDAPHFDMAQGYFDVTTKAFATPKTIDLSHLGWGIDKFPACYLPEEFMSGTEPYGNCNPTELTLRYSFKKVVDNDYEPVDYDGMRFQAYGFFTTEYKGYERNYGMVDDKWFRFAGRYNLWNRSHYYADPVNMTGAVECGTRETTVGPTGDLNQLLYGLTPATAPLAGGGATPVGTHGNDVAHRASVWYYGELSYQVHPTLNLGIAFSTFNPQLAEDSTFRAPFFNRFTEVMLSTTLSIDQLVARIQGPKKK